VAGTIRTRTAALVLAVCVLSALLLALNLLHDVTIHYFRDRMVAESYSLDAARTLSSRAVSRVLSFVGGEGQTFRQVQSLRFLLLIGPFDALYLVGVAAIYTFGGILVLAVTDPTAREGVFFRSASLIGRMARVAATAFVRSYAWFPLIGVFAARYLFPLLGTVLIDVEMIGMLVFLARAPRFALAPLLVADGRAVRESLAESADRSLGFRWAILSGCALVGSAAILGVLLADNLLSSVLPSVPLTIVVTFLWQAAWLFSVLILAHAGRSILAKSAVAHELARLRATIEKGTLELPSLLPESGIDDPREDVRRERRPAHEPAVHVGLPQ
jgi:hypothetical protein